MASPTVIDAAWTFDDKNTSLNGRYVIGALFQNSAAATASNSIWRDGVIPGVYSAAASAYQSLRVTQNSPTGSSVLVQPGHAIVTRTGQGVYVCPNSTARVVALDAANATNPRIDLIVLQVLDQALGDGSTEVQIRAVTGTASGSPVAPALPTGAIELARVAVAAAPTGNTIIDANITDKRKSTGLVGTIRPLLPGDLTSDAGISGDFRFNGSLLERFTHTSGGLWQPIATVNGPFGYVASGTFTTDGGYSANGSETVARSFTFTAQANRRYKVTWSVGILASLSGGLDVTWRGRWATGAGPILTSSTLIDARSTRYEQGKFYTFDHSHQFVGPATAGSVAVGLTFSHSNSTSLDMLAAGNNGNNINTVFVEDIGGV